MSTVEETLSGMVTPSLLVGHTIDTVDAVEVEDHAAALVIIGVGRIARLPEGAWQEALQTLIKLGASTEWATAVVNHAQGFGWHWHE